MLCSCLVGEIDEEIDKSVDLSSIRAEPIPPIRYGWSGMRWALCSFVVALLVVNPECSSSLSLYEYDFWHCSRCVVLIGHIEPSTCHYSYQLHSQHRGAATDPSPWWAQINCCSIAERNAYTICSIFTFQQNEDLVPQLFLTLPPPCSAQTHTASIVRVSSSRWILM